MLAKAERVHAAEALIRQAHSAYTPVLSFNGNWGHSNAIGQQLGEPEVHSRIYPWQAQFDLTWTIFDGGARHNDTERGRSARATR
jgi:outer membrane protein TolC